MFSALEKNQLIYISLFVSSSQMMRKVAAIEAQHSSYSLSIPSHGDKNWFSVSQFHNHLRNLFSISISIRTSNFEMDFKCLMRSKMDFESFHSFLPPHLRLFTSTPLLFVITICTLVSLMSWKKDNHVVSISIWFPLPQHRALGCWRTRANASY